MSQISKIDDVFIEELMENLSVLTLETEPEIALLALKLQVALKNEYGDYLGGFLI